jgi:hypothetical protein
MIHVYANKRTHKNIDRQLATSEGINVIDLSSESTEISCAILIRENENRLNDITAVAARNLAASAVDS